MSENFVFGLIGKEDLYIGEDTFDVTLPNGSIATLHKTNIASLLRSYAVADLPATNIAGNVARATNLSRGLMKNDGTSWYQMYPVALANDFADAGSTFGLKVAAAMTGLPSTGGVVDARGITTGLTIAADPFSGITKPIVLIIGSEVAASVNISVPNNVTIRFERGAKITMATGTTFNCNGQIDAGAYQIFDWTGTGTFSLAPNGPMGRFYEILPEWFGALGNSSHNDSAALQKACDAAAECCATIRLRAAEYAIQSGLSFGAIRIIGSGFTSALVTQASAGPTPYSGNVLVIDCADRAGLELANFKIVCTAGGQDAINAVNCHSWKIDRVHVESCAGTAFNMVGNDFTGVLMDSTASNCGRGFEIRRIEPYGSGGVSIIRFHSGDLDGIGAIVDGSGDVTLDGVELQCKGNGPALLIQSSSAVVDSVAVAIAVLGGQYVSNGACIQIGGGPGTQPVRGVSISGAFMSNWNSPSVNSWGIFLDADNIYGVSAVGCEFHFLSSCVRFDGPIVPGTFDITNSAVFDLNNNERYIDQNGTELKDADGASLQDGNGVGSGFVTRQLNQVITTPNAGVLAYLPSGRIYSSTAEIGNIGGGEDPLMSFSLPAGTFNRVGCALRITVFGTTAANANVKTLKLYFGSTVILTVGPTAANDQHWIQEYVVVSSVIANRQYWTLLISTWNGALLVPFRGEASQTTSGAILIKCTGEGVATGDIIQRGMLVELLH